MTFFRNAILFNINSTFFRISITLYFCVNIINFVNFNTNWVVRLRVKWRTINFIFKWYIFIWGIIIDIGDRIWASTRTFFSVFTWICRCGTWWIYYVPNNYYSKNMTLYNLINSYRIYLLVWHICTNRLLLEFILKCNYYT